MENKEANIKSNLALRFASGTLVEAKRMVTKKESFYRIKLTMALAISILCLITLALTALASEQEDTNLNWDDPLKTSSNCPQTGGMSLKLRNRTGRPIRVAQVLYCNGQWQSDGWHKILAGETIELIAPLNPPDSFFIYAETLDRDMTWPGRNSFCSRQVEAWVNYDFKFFLDEIDWSSYDGEEWCHIYNQNPPPPKRIKRFFMEINTGRYYTAECDLQFPSFSWTRDSIRCS